VVKTYALTSELDASLALVRRDLELLRPWLLLHGLELTLKKGLGVRLDGPESRRRQALCSVIMELFGEAGLLELLRNEAYADTCPDEPLALLLRLYPAEPFRVAERVLSELPKGLLPALAPRDYLGLVVHLGVASVRRDRGRLLEDVIPPQGETPEAAEYDIKGVARAAVGGMSRGLDFVSGDAEVGAVERFLRGAKPERPEGTALEASIGSIAEVRSLIERCGRLLDHDFGDDRQLRDGLAAHWGPALYRLRNRLPIKNPILEQIRTQYASLFEAVRAACTAVFPALAIPDDEVGYLVLHFGSAIERSGSGGERFRAMVVCSAGIGSAYMLASRIRAEFPEIDIVANLSWFDVKDVARESWDLLISTIPLPLDSDEYVLVDPLLSPEGLRAIRAHMTARRSRLGTIERASPPKREGTLGDLKQMGRQLQAVIGVLERLRVFNSERAEVDWEGLLRSAVNRCADAGLVDERESAFVDLRERSRDFGILLPSSRILFLHARSVGVSAASVSLHAFPHALPKLGQRWETAPTRLALMLAPRALDQETQDILNEISVSLLDAGTVEILQSADEANIRAHYSRYLDRYFRSIPLQGA
jgi:mannitol operon transcriptional antiterminator